MKCLGKFYGKKIITTCIHKTYYKSFPFVTFKHLILIFLHLLLILQNTSQLLYVFYELSKKKKTLSKVIFNCLKRIFYTISVLLNTHKSF